MIDSKILGRNTEDEFIVETLHHAFAQIRERAQTKTHTEKDNQVCRPVVQTHKRAKRDQHKQDEKKQHKKKTKRSHKRESARKNCIQTTCPWSCMCASTKPHKAKSTKPQTPAGHSRVTAQMDTSFIANVISSAPRMTCPRPCAPAPPRRRRAVTTLLGTPWPSPGAPLSPRSRCFSSEKAGQR